MSADFRQSANRLTSHLPSDVAASQVLSHPCPAISAVCIRTVRKEKGEFNVEGNVLTFFPLHGTVRATPPGPVRGALSARSRCLCRPVTVVTLPHGRPTMTLRRHPALDYGGGSMVLHYGSRVVTL